MRDTLIKSYDTTQIRTKPSLPLKPKFNINFINGAYFEIIGGHDKDYRVEFINKKTGKVEHFGNIKNNCWIKANKSYFVDWLITANDGETTYKYEPSFSENRVYIALDSKALGDTLAWFPYVEEFRKKHNCKVICSTFHNEFFRENYSEIEFVNPGDTVHNLYAMYTIGWYYNLDGSIDYYKHPFDFKLQPLQKTAADILGLEYKEIVPKIKMKDTVDRENIVSIAIHGTAQAKYWNNNGGWQKVVDYLKSNGYKVVLLSKEEDGYMGNNHPKGIEQLPAGPIDEVIKTLQKSKLFIGIGSGLSWLSWATNTPTFLISGFSYPYTETVTNTYRIEAPKNKCTGCFNTHRLDAGDWNWCPIHKGTDRQFECSKSITAEMVIEAIKPYV